MRLLSICYATSADKYGKIANPHMWLLKSGHILLIRLTTTYVTVYNTFLVNVYCTVCKIV